MLVTKLARVYAKALIDLANEQDQLEEVKTDMEKVAQLIKNSREFDVMLSSPVIKAGKKAAVLREIFTGKVSETSMHFLELVAKHGREGALAAIAQGFKNMYLAQKGYASAVVTTAYKLTEAELSDLNQRIATATGKQIETENKVNPDIIGGIILRVGDRQYNSSIATELERLRRDFKQNQYVADF